MFSQNVAIFGGPPVTNHHSPTITFKCSRSDGYGFHGGLTLALGHSHDLAFHLLTARGQNLVSLTKEANLRS